MKLQTDFRDLPVGERIKRIGHREYVGGSDAETWYGIGLLQFHFLVSRGLQPDHVFLDVACGCLRLGQFLIPYLEPGNYFGLEAESELVRIGLEKELNFDVAALKQPVFGHGYDFDFAFAKPFDFAIAQSLFTHLTPKDIAKCLTGARTKAHERTQFFFTFFEGDSRDNPETSHANMNWRYSMVDLEGFAVGSGWNLEYIGDWNHPRQQMMAVARPV